MNRHGLLYFLALGVVASTILSCGDGGTDPGEGVGEVIVDPPQATIFTDGTVRLTATVLKGDGTPDPDAVVTWSVISGSTVATVGASSGLVTGQQAGTAEVVATAEGVSSDPAIITVNTPVSLVTDYLVGGNVGALYVDRISSEGGIGPTTFAVVSGALPTGLVLDGVTGAISGTPSAAGVFYFTIRATGSETTDQHTYAVAISGQPAAAFNMWVMNVAEEDFIPFQGIVDAFADAVARWERVITGDLDDVTFGPDEWDPTDFGGDAQKLNGAFVDDMVLMVDLAPIDGPGGTLGSAGPFSIRFDPALGSPAVNTIFGRLSLDISDLQSLDFQQLFALSFHEVGHIVGLGTLWNLATSNPAIGGMDLVSGQNTTDPRYEGPMGNAEFAELDDAPGCTGQTKIPIEADGGAATAGGHWDEDKFDQEIMTGFSEPAGVDQPISEMTIASVGDFLYEIDRSAADSYRLPCAPILAPPADATSPDRRDERILNDILRGPLAARLPDGRIIRIHRPE